MANYHRNEASGPQATSMRPGGAGADPITITFRSLRDDLADLRTNAPPGIVDPAVVSLKEKTEQGQNIYAIHIGRRGATPVLIAGGHVAREWITVEIPFLFAKYLVEHYLDNPNVRRLVDASDIWIVPLVNPDGHEHSVLQERAWRKNFPTDSKREAVDLNRNHVTSYRPPNNGTGGVYGVFSDDPGSDIYRGQGGTFAKEVIAMEQLLARANIQAALYFHSHGRFILFPRADGSKFSPNPKSDEIATDLKRVVDSKGATYQNLIGSAYYPTVWGIPPEEGAIPGTLLDSVVDRSREALSLSIDLEPDIADPRAFVLPESEIDRTFDLHRAAILTFLNCAATIRTPLPIRPLTLRAGVTTDLAVFQPECWRAFWTY